MTIKYQASYAGIGEMLKSEFMQAEMKARADKVKELAVATAPVYESGPHPGRYKESITSSSGVREGKSARAYGRVTASAPESLAVEYGTQNNEAHHTLVRALDAAG